MCSSDLEEIANGADFGEMAEQHSDGPTASKKGDLGIVLRGMMVPEFERMAFSLEVNEVSQPVKTQFGYHLIKVFEKTPGEQPPLDEIYDRVAKRMVINEEATIADEIGRASCRERV